MKRILSITLLLFLFIGSTAYADEAADDTTAAAVETVATESVAEGTAVNAATAANEENSARSAAAGERAELPADLSPMGMYRGADVVVKAVMLLLLAASVLTWAVWAFKSVQMRLLRKRVANVLRSLVQADSFAAAHTEHGETAGAAGALLQATALELQLSGAGAASGEGVKERVAARLERVHASAAQEVSRGTSILATTGAVAPFVGLFGTVWGIMHSFVGIAESQTTNLAVVAPGIAEALLATAMGLVAAIPAVVFYNYFSRSIAAYRSDLSDIVASVLILVSRDLDRKEKHAPVVKV